MATKTDRRVVVENVSDQNLGTERPLSLFLRSPSKKRSAHLSRAEINESQVTETMRRWQDDGWIKITPKEEFEKTQSEAKAAKMTKAKTPTPTKPDDKNPKPKGDFDDKDAAVGPDAKGGEPVTNVGPPKKQEPKEPKPMGAQIVASEEKESVATVGSSPDGSPDVSEPEAEVEPEADPEPEVEAEAPEAEPEVEAERYTEEELQGMKMKGLRTVIAALGLSLKSTQKGELIKAILDAQGDDSESEGADDATTTTTEDD